jgi:flagellar basal-body rod protein FlgF
MQNSMDIAASRLMAQQRAMDVVANNIANANTAGFKAERVLFSDWLSDQDGTTVPFGDRPVAYTQDRATYRDESAGALSHSGNPLDIAITGAGYFMVRTAAGTRLTRAGQFTLMQDGTIGDIEGDPLLDTAGRPLQVPAGAAQITIAGDGTLSAGDGAIGKIGVVVANDPYSLKAQGGRLFDAGSGTTPALAPHLVQGAVEESNVQPVLETTRMMDQLRQFQYVAEFVQSESDRMQNAITTITKSN